MNSKNINNSNLEHELAVLRKEMETIRLECDRLLNKESSSIQSKEIKQSQYCSSLPWRQQCIQNNNNHDLYQKSFNRQQQHQQHPHYPHQLKSEYMTQNTAQILPRLQEETSSAYNSGGDSCRSTPLIGVTLTPPNGYQYFNSQYPISTETIHASIRQPTVTISNIPEARKPNQGNTYKLGQTCYTSKDKLAETLAQQQKAVKEMIRTDRFERINTSKDQAKSLPELQKSEVDESKEYTWKLKRRSDGSCYITKKPVKQQILKAREEQLNRERTGLSTDDDAASELKRGRFWTREERKKQLEKAKEKKANKIQKQKNMTVKDQVSFDFCSHFNDVGGLILIPFLDDTAII